MAHEEEKGADRRHAPECMIWPGIAVLWRSPRASRNTACWDRRRLQHGGLTAERGFLSGLRLHW